jgi:hypothetical protein
LPCLARHANWGPRQAQERYLHFARWYGTSLRGWNIDYDEGIEREV